MALEDARTNLTRQWLTKANHDIRAAVLAAGAEDELWDIAAFHTEYAMSRREAQRLCPIRLPALSEINDGLHSGIVPSRIGAATVLGKVHREVALLVQAGTQEAEGITAAIRHVDPAHTFRGWHDGFDRLLPDIRLPLQSHPHLPPCPRLV